MAYRCDPRSGCQGSGQNGRHDRGAGEAIGHRSHQSGTVRQSVQRPYGPGEDVDFFKTTPKYLPIRTGPFYAVEIRATAMVSCHAGIEIDPDGHALDGHGRVVQGLYAGGEVLGCTLGRRYIGGGIGIANALIFGRIAGETAAAESAMVRQLVS
ncbi:FAD-binding protein [Sphingobium sp. CR2-8]|uniref:FAD-binding protein n=1 Tax=Sphingobium sp. CR2-8 TaxID=1306534 RepID=UPI003FA35B57